MTNTAKDAALAARHAPRLQMDTAEPYRPVAFGYTVFRAAGPSQSSRFLVEPRGLVTIEYAIYYDFDIGHLYDLEHVWVHLGSDGDVVAVEASAHGQRLPMDIGTGLPAMLDDRPILYAEAGKHAHWAAPDHMTPADRQKLVALCGPLAGMDGIHLGNDLARRRVWTPDARDYRLARLRLQADAFPPSFAYVPFEEVPLQTWAELEASIPTRVCADIARLHAATPHFGAIFIDCGDTLIDERTEVRQAGSDIVISGDLIPGARNMLDRLKAAGHTLVLVADGPRQSFVNLLSHHGLWDHFDAHAISEDVGALKPDPRMFEAALANVGLTPTAAWRTVMVGNNLSRDIKGANGMGITSVFLAWSTLRSHMPTDPSEVPDYTIASPQDLPLLLDRLEILLGYRAPA